MSTSVYSLLLAQRGSQTGVMLEGWWTLIEGAFHDICRALGKLEALIA